MKVGLHKMVFRFAIVGVLAMAVAFLIVFFASDPQAVAIGAVGLQESSIKPLENPPEGQTYMGTKQCSACHFDQFMEFRQTKHAKSFEILPEKYREDASCLECHTTGYGEESGYKDSTTSDLAGTSCEACHGPGSKHGEIAQQYANQQLTKEEELYIRSTIHLLIPNNACVSCHKSKGHHPHPEYDKE